MLGIAFLGQRLDDTLHIIAHRADGQHGHVAGLRIALGQSAARTHLYLRERAAPVCQHTTAARIADDEGSLVGQLSREHQPPQLALVHRRGYREIGDRTKGGHVERTVMGRAVFAD